MQLHNVALDSNCYFDASSICCRSACYATNMDADQLAEYRKNRLSHLADKYGGKKALGQALGYTDGATYLQSLAAEMQATATMCDVRSRELNANLDSMKKELRELQAQQ